jgi:hypothetical protein
MKVLALDGPLEGQVVEIEDGTNTWETYADGKVYTYKVYRPDQPKALASVESSREDGLSVV